jgi:hypothetical protein
VGGGASSVQPEDMHSIALPMTTSKTVFAPAVIFRNRDTEEGIVLIIIYFLPIGK